MLAEIASLRSQLETAGDAEAAREEAAAWAASAEWERQQHEAASAAVEAARGEVEALQAALGSAQAQLSELMAMHDAAAQAAVDAEAQAALVRELEARVEEAERRAARALEDGRKEGLELAERHDFQIFADECYAELYRDTPPPGALEIAAQVGAHPERVVIFHSLSKRSNMPGLRSGFAAGGPDSIARMKQLRNYAGAPLPLPLQAVATRAWSDEDHVEENRALYRAKYAIADEILGDVPGYVPPQAGFFLWLPVADGEAAAVKLWRKTGVRVLPGAYLAREVDGATPGADRIRVAMVAPEDEMRDGLTRLRSCLYGE
jgi:hypothetical protein